MKSDLPTFMKSGVLGEIAVDLSRDGVVNFLGIPDEWEMKAFGRLQRDATWWNYGLLSIHFKNDSVFGFGLYWLACPELRIHPELALTGWVPPANTSIGEMREFMDRNGISFRTIDVGRGKGDLITTGNVRLVSGGKQISRPILASLIRFGDLAY